MSRTAKVVVPLAGLLGLAVFTTVFFLRTDTQRFRIPSESMRPTIGVGDHITANKDAYDDADPQRQDIVVSHPPRGAIAGGAQCGRPVGGRELCPEPAGGPADVFFVHRIVAVPGDRLRIVDGHAIVDGKRLDEPYAQDCPAAELCTFRGEITIPPGHYFVMGDNRGASDDSRFWGPVPRANIVGRVDDCWPLGLKCEKTSDPG
jgi:signal peptidase I